MSPTSSRVPEIGVRLAPRRQTPTQTAASDVVRLYDAWIYAPASLEGVTPPDPSLIPSAYETAGGLSVVGLERVAVRWNRYQEYLSAFLEGEKGPRQLGEQLFRTLSDGLQGLLSRELQRDSPGAPLRLWWASETPELDDLPWELMASTRPQNPASACTFLRGLPPPPSPPLAVGGRLRLGLIHPRAGGDAPHALISAMNSLHQAGAVEVVRYEQSPRKALRQAATDGVELIHIVADGFVSMSYDGILYLHHADEPSSSEIGASELVSTLSGSRVSLIGLSEPQTTSPDTMTIGGQRVPSVYRAFACLGATRQPLPTMVAPLGPMPPGDIYSFWSGFYRGLAESSSVDSAMASGSGQQLCPMAVFSRQRGPRLFSSASEDPVTAERWGGRTPAVMVRQMGLSRALMDDADDLRKRTGSLPPDMEAFLQRESTRHSKLQAQLEPYLKSQEKAG